MAFKIKVPAVGESITEATIGEWLKNDGDQVERDEVILNLETDKASVEVVAETSGILKTKASNGDVVAIGAVIGEIEESASGATSKKTEKSEKSEKKEEAPKKTVAQEKSESLSPAVKKMMAENDLEAKDVEATGPKGNITKEDVLNALQKGSKKSEKPVAKTETKTKASRESERVPMTTLRRRIAERLVQAQQTAAILTTFNEVDMTAVMNLRKKYKEDFQKKHDVSLGFMGFFVKAAVEALKAYPRVNAFIDGNDIVFHNYYNVGIAVGTEKGLMVPVLKNVQEMSIAEIESGIKTYAGKARDGKISVDDLSGGTFTISNGGVYGSLMSTPILNPPQSAILGMHKIQDRVMVIDGQMVIRPMMYLALSYDHRIIDGSESVGFLVKIKEGLEDPARLILEI